MECWKQGCKNEVKVCFKWTDPVSYSCKIHIYKHALTSSIEEHRLETLESKVNPKNKELIIEELHKLSKELLDIKENLIKKTYKKIEELKLSLIKALENIEKIRINQADLIRKIYSIKSISKMNQNPLEKLLSLDLDSAQKQLGEFGCTFNSSDFDINEKDKIDTIETNEINETNETNETNRTNETNETNEIVFFRNNTKNAVRVNLNNFSMSEQRVDIFQSNIQYSSYISMCLLPDKSIFCYGNDPASGTTFILYPNDTIKLLSDGVPSRNMGAVHHNGFIYLFGGWNAAGNVSNQASKYELSTNKWYKICPLKENLVQVSCLSGNYGIVFVGQQSSKIYYYDHNQDIHNEVYTNFAVKTFKVLLQAENRIFLIESSKNIYESEPNQLSSWKVIGTSQISFGYRAAYQVYFNRNCYFMDSDSKIYKLDLNTLQLTMTQV